MSNASFHLTMLMHRMDVDRLTGGMQGMSRDFVVMGLSAIVAVFGLRGLWEIRENPFREWWMNAARWRYQEICALRVPLRPKWLCPSN